MFDENVIISLGFFSIKKIFIGSIIGLVLVYFVRFYSLAYNGIKSGYEKINIAVDESAYLLGYSKEKHLREAISRPNPVMRMEMKSPPCNPL